MDIDLIFTGAVPDSIEGFKKIRPHAFEHISTGVEVGVFSASFLNIKSELIAKVRATAHLSDGLLIASPEGLIVLKLHRWSRQDQADIEAIWKACHLHVNDLEPWFWGY